MEPFRVGQLTKEMVATRLKALGDPCAAAADVVKKTLTICLKGTNGWSEPYCGVFADVCQGGLTGLLLSEQSLAKGATLILHAVAEVCSEQSLDAMDAMRCSLRGMARIKMIARAADIEDMRRAVRLEFMGAGEELDRQLEAVPTDGITRTPPYV
jgi:hypothetical protein